jgi:hypothetical protein
MWVSANAILRIPVHRRNRAGEPRKIVVIHLFVVYPARYLNDVFDERNVQIRTSRDSRG